MHCLKNTSDVVALSIKYSVTALLAVDVKVGEMGLCIYLVKCMEPQYIANGEHGHSAVQHGTLLIYSSLAANKQFMVVIGQKIQLTG